MLQDKEIKKVAGTVPVVVTEMGHGISWAQGLMTWIEKQSGTISYLPWTWNTWGAMSNNASNTTGHMPLGETGGGEALVKNYNGEPTSWGQAVKDSFAKARTGVPLAATPAV